MSNKVKANRNYKDAFFHFVFGNENHKEFALSLYNALNDTNYTDVNDLKIVTLEHALYLDYKNDAAVIVDTTLSMWEGQSTWNPNMPIRFLLYAAGEYDKYIAENELYLYSPRLLTIPTPKCVVLYTGNKRTEPVMKQRLSDMYKGNGDIEVVATVYNINSRYGNELLGKSRPLFEYSWFLDGVENGVGSLVERIDRRLKEMPDDYELKKLLLLEKRSVIKMLLTEYDEKRNRELMIKDAKEIGLEEGRAEGRAEGIVEGVAQGKAEMIRSMHDSGMSLEQIADIAKCSVDEVKKILDE